MPSLRDLQISFFRALCPGADATDPEPALLGVIDGRGTLDAPARVDVYAQMYWMRIADALHEDFPRVAALVDHEGFHVLARAYLAVTPSRHPSLRHVGDRFADFLATRPAAEVPPFAADLARLEWTRLEVFDAPEAALLTLADLRQVAPEEWATLRLATIPALRVLDLHWPAHAIWAAEDDAAGRDWEPAPTTVRVWRDEFRVYQAPMDAGERVALATLGAGGTFGDACAAVADVVPPQDAAERAGALLLRWIDDHILAAL
jgi:hypothetical protein